MNSKLHYKMFKAGKKWVYASIATAGLGLATFAVNATSVHADSTTDNDASNKIDDDATTAPVSEASVTLTKTAQKVSSAASSTATSSAASSVASKATQSVAKTSEAASATDSKADSSASSKAVESVAKSSEASSATSSVASSASSKAVESVAKASDASSAASSSATTKVSSAASSSVASSSSAANVKTSSAASSSSASVKNSSASDKANNLTSKKKSGKKSSSSKDYTIDNTYKLNGHEGSDEKTNNNIIVAHATGVYAPARNVAIYEKREWDTSETYVQYIVGDGGKVYAVGKEGYVAWGAGKWANENAPVQVELAQTYSSSQFKIDYKTYVELLRDSAKKWHISTTLDSSAKTGIKSHIWISRNVWGDHADPYGYLATHGISKNQFAHDLKYGFGTNDDSNSSKNNGSKDNGSKNHGSKDNGNSGKKNNGSIKVGSQVTINKSAKHWATGQSILSSVKGHTYKVIQVNGNRILLDKVISWINKGDVTLKGGSSNHSSSNKGNKGHKDNNNSSSSKSKTIKVGTKVTINKSAKKWATGQKMLGAVKGHTYKVIQIKGNRLLLDKVISWINKGDVTVPGSSSKGSSSNSSSKSNKGHKDNNNSSSSKSKTIKVGTKVTINKSAKKWATGQKMLGAVKGHTYKVIQINGNRLLLDKVISWINKGDVTVPGSSSKGSSSNSSSKSNKGHKGSNNSSSSKSKTIKVGSKVTINKSAKHWATGQSILGAVKGKSYKVIQMNGSRLLLDKVISWINKSDVTLTGSGASSHSSNHSNSNHSNSNKNYHLTNKRWTATQTKFVNTIAKDVVNVCRNNQLYASVAMAQAVLESAYGSSSLSQNAHNLYGIKAGGSWKGATYVKSTKEVINGRTITINAAFRKYDSFKDSIADYASLLESRSQYANAFTSRADNYVQAIKAIKAGGYATAPAYVSNLVNCVNRNGFYVLDDLKSAISL
jgi:N-acetylmuramoyl-L-alanine amidase